MQLIPFVLCGLGLAAVLWALLRPRRPALLALRACMAVAVLGSLYGVYEHVAGNLAFHREVHPNAPAAEVFMGAVGGSSPLLAPGILALAAVMAMAATYYHPALTKGRDERGD